MADIHEPSRWRQSHLAQPMFNFPPQTPRSFTPRDLIAILKLYKIGPPAGNSKPSWVWNDRALTGIQEVLDGRGDRTRKIIRYWPRDPDGQPITPENSCLGKMTPNQIQFWGSTIFDFYYVQRIPNYITVQSITTGSKILAWVKAQGELNHAKSEIQFAENENNPEVLPPWSPQFAIERMEERIWQRKEGKSIAAQTESPSPQSAFDPSTYPDPWPLVPFSYPTERLTCFIDPLALPKRLVVHDPWNLLEGDADVFAYNKSRTYTPGKTVVLTLETHEQPRTSSTDDNDSETVPPGRIYDDESDVMLDTFYLHPPTTLGLVPPPILVAHSLPPHKEDTPRQIDEAHLYLSPSKLAGSGNHSFVYRAELELPRSVVIPEPPDHILCKSCVEQDINNIIKLTDGENGEHMDPKWKEDSAEVVQIYEGRPPTVLDFYQFWEKADPNRTTYQTLSITDTTKSYLQYTGPSRLIKTSVEWQDRMNPTCPHLSPPAFVPPPTVKMTVIAKLSIQYDDHLAREAEAYQKFPKHIFEHWSGLNVIRPLHDPVPIAPIVPQFYGYYVPDKRGYKYTSPILLLEDCGEQVANYLGLTTDQRCEATSLLYRFHLEGWVHGSVFPRNFLVQPGPLTSPPSWRSRRTPSFRLVDFGRSMELPDESCVDSCSQWRNERWMEMTMMRDIFGVLPGL